MFEEMCQSLRHPLVLLTCKDGVLLAIAELYAKLLGKNGE